MHPFPRRAVAALVAASTSLTSLAALTFVTAVPAAAQDLPALDGIVTPAREAELVVLTGQDIPSWSVPAAVGQPYPTPDGGRFDGVRSAHHGVVVAGPDAGAPVDQVTAWAFDSDAAEDPWTEVPVQVDERFPYFLANANSDFGIYSGVDYELTYAWGGDGIHTTGEEAWRKVAGGTSLDDLGARYPREDELADLDGVITPGMGETALDYLGAMADPAVGLDTDDEVVFMASDAGAMAPTSANPAGVDLSTRQQVVLADPITGAVSYVYLYLADGGSSFTADTGYVQHERDETADWWADRGSWVADDPEKLGTSNTGYGANVGGQVWTKPNLDGGIPVAMVAGDEPRNATDRWPLDGMTVTTPSYRATTSGRWMFRSMQVARTEGGGYGDDLIDRWKGRAFQQSPDATVSLVGFEDEQVNWEANSSLLGWRSGPVRTIREIWGADSGTNVTKTETFMRDGIQHRYRVRVHPIPPDGLYTSWDYNRDQVACYFNAVTVAQGDLDPTAVTDVTRNPGDDACPGGVAIDGVNDDVGQIDEIGGFPAFFDAPDPTFDIPLAVDRWEQVAGRAGNGSLVYMFEISGPTIVENPLIVPYYRDDMCLDDGTGDDPVARPWPGDTQDKAYPTTGYACDDVLALTRQGAFGSHGVHFFFTHDSDNAFLNAPVPITEVDGSQWQWAVPQDAPAAVGEAYAQMARVPLVAMVVPQAGPEAPVDVEPLMAGAAIVDSTWHVGAAAGQYAGKNVGMVDYHEGLGIDPHAHSTSAEASYGIQGRESVRALVLDDGADRWAVVANDLYIPQDVVNERVAAILAEHDALVAAGLADGPATGITRDNLTVSVSHSHSSPYYSATTWGPWAFQDVFDVRFFEHIAQRMADAVIQAAATMEPAELGAGQSAFHHVKTHSYGPSVAEIGPSQGTPAGYHQSDLDHNLSVVAINKASGPDAGQPIATWVVWGAHPEMDDGNDLMASEWWNTTERMVDREIGGVTLFSQRDTGSSEDGKGADRYFDPQLREEFSDRHFAQIERASRLISDAITFTRANIGAGAAPAPLDRSGAPLAIFDEVNTSDFATERDLAVTSLRFAPPGAQASPEASNCNMSRLTAYQPGVPIVGLPDCQFLPVDEALPAEFREAIDPRVTVSTLEQAGIPIPDDYGAPSVAALEESAAVLLQAIRIGDIGVTVCPCEQFADQSRNIVSRLDRTEGNLFFGYDWTANAIFSPTSFAAGTSYVGGSTAPNSLQLPITAENGYLGSAGQYWCDPIVDGAVLPDYDGSDPVANGVSAGQLTWSCIHPGAVSSPAKPSNGWGRLAPVSDAAFRVMKAEIYNDAAGWDDLANGAEAESEPSDPAAIWGNFTHEELLGSEDGYAMVLPVGMTNDYFGYLVSYREFRSHDHYRKALTGLGAHSQDFMATRLTRMAADLADGGSRAADTRTPKDELYAAIEGPRMAATGTAIGELAQAYLPAYEATLPADGGEPRWLDDLAGVEVPQFSALEASFVGGSNYTDTPRVLVERLVEGADETTDWVVISDGSGEVPLMVDFPDLADGWTPNLIEGDLGEGELSGDEFAPSADLALYRAGLYEWTWTANVEAFTSDIDLHDATGTPTTGLEPGTYRLRALGCHRSAVPTGQSNDPAGACRAYDPSGRVAAYDLPSEPFEVVPYALPVPEVVVDGTAVLVSFPEAGFPWSQTNTDTLADPASGAVIDFPDSYSSAFPFITNSPEVKTYNLSPDAWERFCFTCSFRPWADAGIVDEVVVTVVNDSTGAVKRSVAAQYQGNGVYAAPVLLARGEAAFVAAGDATVGLDDVDIGATTQDSGRVGLTTVTTEVSPTVLHEATGDVMVIDVGLDGPVTAPINVTIAMVASGDSPADPATDLDGPATHTVTLDGFNRTAQLLVPVADDDLVESNETFVVTTSASTTTLSRPVVQGPIGVTIVSDDVPMLMVPDDLTVSETAGHVDLVFALDQPWSDGRDVTFDLVRVRGTTNKADSRFVAAHLELTADGHWLAAVTIELIDDSAVEYDETLELVIANLEGAEASRGGIVLTITSDEQHKPAT